MPRYSLRTLLLGTAVTWVAAIVGAIGGGLIAEGRISENIRFAISWGGVWGLIPSGFALAVLTEQPRALVAWKRWWLCAWAAVAIVSGLSFYFVTVISANV